VIHRPREHRVVLFARELLLRLAERRCAVLQRNDLVALLVSGSHGRLDAAVREESAECDRVDTAAAENKVEIRAGEAAQAALAFDNDIAGLRLEDVDDLRAPAALAERLAIDHALQNAIRLVAELAVAFDERDWRVHDRASGRARLFHRLDGVLQHVVLFHDALHGIVQRAALRREVVLVFNQDYRRSLGIHIFLLELDVWWTAVHDITRMRTMYPVRKRR
jgi:hypothetical protein